MKEVITETNCKNVESYWIEQNKSGIIHLCINTVDRWMNYHHYSDDQYYISEHDADIDNESVEEHLSRTLKIPKDYFEFQEGVMYMPTHIQNKDQISYYFIPYPLITKGK